MTRIRQPIVTVLGHVDAGKTSLLDKIRGTSVVLREVGDMTQHIGASMLPKEIIYKIAGPLVEKYNIDFKFSGLLIIDTPGHAVFSNLRKRGGSVADISILVVDVINGLQAQTYESLSLLKARGVPFVIAANKIDRIDGWVPAQTLLFSESIKTQTKTVIYRLNQLIGNIIEELSHYGYTAQRFDEVRDFKTTVPIVPTSAVTGEGIAELLLILAGMSQRFMLEKLEVTEGFARGTVLEVKEITGMGHTIDVIIYDGVLRKNDTIVIGSLKGPIVTKIKALLVPQPLDEIRDPKKPFQRVDEVVAAAGVKIAAPELEEAIPGSPIIATDNVQAAVEEVKKELEEILIATESTGVIVKGDALGSIEAMCRLLDGMKIPVRKADIGDVTKTDVMDALTVREKDPSLGAILAFRVKVPQNIAEMAKNSGVEIFLGDIVYKIIDSFDAWHRWMKDEIRRKKMEGLVMPGKIKILPYVFRRSNPAIVGVEVLAGQITPGVHLINQNGRKIGQLHQIQDKGESLKVARKGAQVAVSIDEGVVGRNIEVDDILIVDMTEENFKKLKEVLDELTPDDKELMKELALIKRQENQFWGI
ncbi:MAG: translation initiation factor IF-2 [Candidatus Korarchaeota archaeon]